MPTTPVAVVVPVKSAWYSKINWTQAVGMLAMLGTAFGGFDITPETQVEIVTAIGLAQGAITYILKTFFTNTVTPAAIPPGTVIRE